MAAEDLGLLFTGKNFYYLLLQHIFTLFYEMFVCLFLFITPVRSYFSFKSDFVDDDNTTLRGDKNTAEDKSIYNSS